MKLDTREPWEVVVSVQLQNIDWYLGLLLIDDSSGRAKTLLNIYDSKSKNSNLHVWAMKRVISITERVVKAERSKGARVRLSQEKLDRIKEVTGIEAIEYRR